MYSPHLLLAYILNIIFRSLSRLFFNWYRSRCGGPYVNYNLSCYLSFMFEVKMCEDVSIYSLYKLQILKS